MHNEEGDFTSVRSVLLYVRDEVQLPDKVRRKIAQKKMLKGQIKNILQHFHNLLTFVRF